MQINGFALVDKVSNDTLQRWEAVPGRVDLPGGDVVMSAESGWENDAFRIEPTTWTVDDPPIFVPQIISDRQFFQQLAVQGVITQDEALAAVGPGTLPAALVSLVAALPSEQQFSTNMLLKGAVQFDRRHPMVGVLGAAFGWNGGQLDDLWRAASLL